MWSGESPRKNTCSRRLREAILDLWQPSSRRCDPKTWETVLGGKMCRQAPGGRFWRTAMDPHMGKGRPGACGTQMRQSKEMKFWACYHTWRMCESGVWESWGSTCSCMKGRGAGSSQPAWLRNSRDRRPSDASKVNPTVRSVSDSTEWELEMTASSSQLALQTSPLSAKAWVYKPVST